MHTEFESLNERLAYIRNLIDDLCDSGSNATADDFEDLIDVIEQIRHAFKPTAGANPLIDELAARLDNVESRLVMLEGL